MENDALPNHLQFIIYVTIFFLKKKEEKLAHFGLQQYTILPIYNIRYCLHSRYISVDGFFVFVSNQNTEMIYYFKYKL